MLYALTFKLETLHVLKTTNAIAVHCFIVLAVNVIVMQLTTGMVVVVFLKRHMVSHVVLHMNVNHGK